MSNTIQIKHGASVPTTDQLAPYEFGYCTDEGKLYLNANGTIKSFLPNIESGFTLNNNTSIEASLSNGESAKLILRNSENHLWLGDRRNTSQGSAYISVGNAGSEIGYLYVTRAHHYVSTDDYSDIYRVYDELSIQNGFTIKNNIAIKTKLADETLCSTFYRSKNNYLWLGGSDSTSSNESVGRVNLVVGLGKEKNDVSQNFAYVYRKDLQASSKILDYGYIAKNVWSGSCAVGGTFSIPNFEDYRFFIINLTGSGASMLVMRRSNYLRGGNFYANGGLYFECIRCNGNSSGTFTYNEGRSYTLTTSGATSNWGTSSSPAPNIVNIWGVL